ncbi:hypothetical protein [Amycolatopsis jiangsuensis]|uniref:Uncharacterized protein n=1 Tax=Amycolatopsis jiangsuensis TaxID=1181879 RepID=A0A840IYW6_9PSEU|nr:hypothetical protein [Amycolatopsis jiangsuensis]MBB4686605.1 hypothetical protein [Amycolatopsis jiangsuensis]
MATHWIWYVIAPLVIIGCALFYWRRYQRNKAAATAYATQRGWTYTERDQDLLGRCHGAPFDGFGRRRRAWHAVRGQHGPYEVLSFEYSEVRGRNHGNRYARRVFRQLASLKLPFPAHEVYATPRGRIGRLANQAGLTGSGTGNPDIDSEWATEGLIPPAVQDWLATHRRRPFRVVAGRLETWHEGRFDPNRIDPAVADLEDLAQRLSR